MMQWIVDSDLSFFLPEFFFWILENYVMQDSSFYHLSLIKQKAWSSLWNKAWIKDLFTNVSLPSIFKYVVDYDILLCYLLELQFGIFFIRLFYCYSK